jgi:hypothetical protein
MLATKGRTYMTPMTTRAAMAALMLAVSSLALSSTAFAQRETADGPTTRGGRPAQATAKPAAGPQLSAAVGRALGNVQKLVGTKNFPEAMKGLKEAQIVATTDYDKLKINQFLTVVSINMADEAGAAAAAEAAADLPDASIPDEDKKDVYTNAAALALNAKHNDKAIVYVRKMIALNLTDARAQQIITTAMYSTAPPAESIAYFQQRMDAAAAAGQRPPRTLVDMKINAHIKANDNPGAERTLEQALLLFNDVKDWDQMFNVAITTPGIRDIDAVMMGRLMFVTGFPVSKDNAQLIGEISQKMAMYGDSQTAQQKGATLTLDAARINGDKASMPEQIKLGATQNGIYNVKLSEALYGYAMYLQAESAARLALTKGGIDNSEAQMLIGMSLFQQGKLPEAAQAFEQVTGGGPATPRVARLWGTFTKTKTAAAPAPAPATP